jgi:hypothetical protein
VNSHHVSRGHGSTPAGKVPGIDDKARGVDDALGRCVPHRGLGGSGHYPLLALPWNHVAAILSRDPQLSAGTFGSEFGQDAVTRDNHLASTAAAPRFI